MCIERERVSARLEKIESFERSVYESARVCATNGPRTSIYVAHASSNFVFTHDSEGESRSAIRAATVRASIYNRTSTTAYR